MPVGLGGNLSDLAVVFAIGKCVHSDERFLFRTKPSEIILGDVQFHLQIVQIGQREYRTRRAGKLSGEQFALFYTAVQNRARDWSANHRRIQLLFRVCGLSFGLSNLAFGPRNFLYPRAKLRQLKTLFQRVRTLLAGFILRRRIVQGLLGKHSLRD